jgi:signal transduction histidine kinase
MKIEIEITPDMQDVQVSLSDDMMAMPDSELEAVLDQAVKQLQLALVTYCASGTPSVN